jgi:hypothetical protein
MANMSTCPRVSLRANSGGALSLQAAAATNNRVKL